MKDYHCTMFKHVMKFLKPLANLKLPLSKHYFTNFLKDLSTQNLVNLCKLLATKIAKLLKKLYATLGKRAWIPQHEKIKQISKNCLRINK
jgi:hypothetical protein